jgi:L-ascorbate metabolism protein UlaG (beta-lactamase superfamily)
MKITFLENSGFMVVTDKAVIIFDYFHDPANKVVKELEHKPELPVVFFVSHHHSDHFNNEIFNLGQNHRREYVISNDVRGIADTDLPIQWMSRGDIVENLPGISKVEALGSTDEGVSFALTLPDGKKLFHAGDLNCWHWKEENTPGEVKKAVNLFETQVDRIATLYPEFDVIFFPVDARQGRDTAMGAAIFIDKIKVKNFFPMHFGGDYRPACDFYSYPLQAETSTEFHCLHKPGESVDII